MKKWKIVLDEGALMKFILGGSAALNSRKLFPDAPTESDQRLKMKEELRCFQNIIEHHCLVYSDCLGDYICNRFGELYSSHFLNYVSSECDAYNSLKAKASGSSMNEWLRKLAEDEMCPDWFIVYDNPENSAGLAEILKRRFGDETGQSWADRVLYPYSETVRKILANQLIRISPDIKIRIKNNTSCRSCAKWFSEILCGESVISIFDQYIFNERGFTSFEKYIAPCFAEGADVRLFTDEDIYNGCKDLKDLKHRTISDRMNALATSRKIKISVFTAKKRVSVESNNKRVTETGEEHDRHIFLSNNIHVTIGKGIDFMDAETGKTVGTGIGIFTDYETTPASLQREYVRNGTNKSTYKPAAVFPRGARKAR